MLDREHAFSPVVKKRKTSPYLKTEDKEHLNRHVSLPFNIDSNSYDMKMQRRSLPISPGRSGIESVA